MGEVAIAVYRPKPGMGTRLREVVSRHYPALLAGGFVTGQQAFVMRAASGAVVEVFEWVSRERKMAAHADPAVLQVWDDFEACAEFPELAALAEAGHPFATFEGMNSS